MNNCFNLNRTRVLYWYTAAPVQGDPSPVFSRFFTRVPIYNVESQLPNQIYRFSLCHLNDSCSGNQWPSQNVQDVIFLTTTTDPKSVFDNEQMTEMRVDE